MKVLLLDADLAELAQLGVAPAEALARGAEAIGARPTHDKPTAHPHTEEGARELVHLFAEAAADLHLLQFGFATSAGDYEASRRRYDLVEQAMYDVQKTVVPELRRRLRELRQREAELEQAAMRRGVDATAIGPFVPDGRAIDPTPRPGEGEEEPRRFPPLPPRRTFLERLFGARR